MNEKMIDVKIDCSKIDDLTKRLIGSSLMADLIAHFNDPENQKKFEEWKKEREAKMRNEK